MVTAMDDVIGKLIEDLKFKGMYNNSIIIFVSDNGGLNTNIGGASNLPLRGGKGPSINYVGRRGGGGLAKCLCYYISLCSKLDYGGGSKIGKILPT